MTVVKFTVIGFLAAFLLLALHRRACTPTKRADRKTRREERRRRRAYRRAMKKNLFTRFLCRITGHASDDDSDDYEEKRARLLSDAEDGRSTTMTEEIAELRNAVGVVEEIVQAQEHHQPQPQPQAQPIDIPASEDSPLMRDYDVGSQVGEGEELPAYEEEDNEGSETSSLIADGFRYTPGSTEYSPSHSPSGSVSDILGPDMKN
jgi:hypothetical protein